MHCQSRVPKLTPRASITLASDDLVHVTCQLIVYMHFSSILTWLAINIDMCIFLIQSIFMYVVPTHWCYHYLQEQHCVYTPFTHQCLPESSINSLIPTAFCIVRQYISESLCTNQHIIRSPKTILGHFLRLMCLYYMGTFPITFWKALSSGAIVDLYCLNKLNL